MMNYWIKDITCFCLLIQLFTLSYANIDDCVVNCGDLVQCTFQDILDCKNYVHCYLSGNAWVRLVRPCGFGKLWSPKHRLCIHASAYNCTIDPCVSGTKKFYKYKSKEEDINENTCGKYWDCKNGKSVPNCCCEGYAFIEGEGCVRDRNCTGSCKTFPRTRKCAHIVSSSGNVSSNDTSQPPTTVPKKTVPPETEGSELFDLTRDILQETTVSDMLEQDPCNDPEIAREGHYKDETLNNHGCQSFWMCMNGVSRFTCCPHGSRYVNNSGCVGDFNCYDCIPNKLPKFVCTTEDVPSHRRKYIQDVDGIKYHRECPCGLRYEKTAGYCGCVQDQDWRTDPECTACKPDVALNFNETSTDVLNCKETPQGNISEKSYSIEDVWSSSGGQKAAVLHGIPIVCSPSDDFSAAKFGYHSYVEVPFFQNNAAVLKRLYLKMKFKSSDMGSTKQILVSNCRFGEPYPSLEVTIDKSSSYLKIWASTGANNASFQIPFEEFQWNVFILSFDGEVLKASVYPDNPRPNLEYKKESILPGEILVSVQPGLRFGSCVQPGDVDGGTYFYGYIKYVKIYSCKPEHNQTLKSKP